VVYNFQTGNTNIKLLTGYEGVTQEVSFGIAVLAALHFRIPYQVLFFFCFRFENYRPRQPRQ
jgi:hypothetical protein